MFLSIAKKCRVVILFHSEAIVIATLARILGKKSVYYIGGSGLMSMLARSGESRVEVLLAHLLGRLQNLIASIATILVATSWCTIREARLDKFTSKVRICPPFVDSEKFTVSRPYENRDLIVGYVGRLEAEKGVEQFLQAAKLTLSARGDVRFLIVGDGSLRQELRRGIHDERIAFRGLVSHAAVASYLNELALLVVPSFTEGIPRVVLEAMSCGTPVLATDVGGIREVIKDGRTGFLLGTNNPELIATKVLFLARNHSLLRSISVESRKLAEDSFTFQAMATSWGRVLHEVSEMRT